MSRIVSVWLPRWPILRFLIAQARNPSGRPVDPGRPFVLAIDASGGPCIAALNAAAEAEGLMTGDRLADARAKIGMLQARPADPVADDAALRRLALWATRYTPVVSPWSEANGANGFFLDVVGAAHLFGGEEMLLADLSYRLDCFGLPARLAVADTPGAAWALARFHPEAAVVLPSGQETEALAPLPIEALRLASDACTTLRRFGFKRVGSLVDKPRASFAARFERELLNRIDQALGRAPEPLALIVPPPVYHSLRYLLEPITTREAVVTVATRLMQDLIHVLVRDGVGARALRLMLYRVDGEVDTVDFGLSAPTRSAAHITRLIDLKLEHIAETVDTDAGFGFEALGLAVTVAERMEPQQTELASVSDEADRTERYAALIDRLSQWLGPRSVRQLKPIASHIPERAEAPCGATGEVAVWPASDEARLRPLLLLRHPELTLTAPAPEGLPRRFHWRGVTHGIARMQGPERIANEWWHDRAERPTRDYYLVEDETGRRFWLYREEIHGRETAAPRWFVHGLFA